MYVELTPKETLRDLRTILFDALPGFEFPRINLYDFTIEEITKPETEVTDDDFIIGVLWDDVIEPNDREPPLVVVENSRFNSALTTEEINIIALLMQINWVQRQLTSIENTRMKYSGSDFKMTSQANHMAKLQSLKSECLRESHHMQRLYKRRRLKKDDTGYRSNWDVFNKGVYYD